MLRFKPLQMLEVDLGAPLSPILPAKARNGERYQRALSLVRLHGQPLGLVELTLPDDGLSATEYARQIWRGLAAEVTAHLRADGLPAVAGLTEDGLPGGPCDVRSDRPDRPDHPPACRKERDALLGDAPFVSIVVATRDRPEGIAACLRSLLALDYPRYEIVVVDNAPSTPATSDLIRHTYGGMPCVRYVREDRPGISWARNRGLREAQGTIVAFTDDDVVVDAQWLSALVAAFDVSAHVACVTGLVVPREIETPCQAWFEQAGGFNKGFTRRLFDLDTHRAHSPLYPFSAGIFGTGNNMAFKASTLRAMDGFDPALGVGTAALGGEDLAAYFQIIMSGKALVYEPAAIVYHAHRTDYAALRKQMYAYGAGLTAYLTKCLLDNPGLIGRFARTAPHGLLYAVHAQSAKNSKKALDYPKDLTRVELKGMLHGPAAYVRSRRQTRQEGRRCQHIGDVGYLHAG